MSWLDKPNTQIRADDGTLFPPQPTTQVTGPGAPAVSTDPANRQTILTFPDATVVTKHIDAGSAPIAQGYVAMQKNGKLTLATTAALALGLYHAGIVLAAGVAGGQTSIITQGMIDPATFNLGAGFACAVGTDANGAPVRVTDVTCASGLKFVGVCDVNGAIYVQPASKILIEAPDFGVVPDADPTNPSSGTDNSDALDALIAFINGTSATALKYQNRLYFPAGFYKFTRQIGPFPFDMTVFGDGLSDQETRGGFNPDLAPFPGGTTFLCYGFGVGVQLGNATAANVTNERNSAIFQGIEVIGQATGDNTNVVNFVNTATTVTVSASAKTYTRSTGSWISEGFKVGDTVYFGGFDTNTHDGNNHRHYVTALSATVMTVAEALADEATVASVTCVSYQYNDVGIEVAGDVGVVVRDCRIGGFKRFLSFDGCESCLAFNIHFDGQQGAAANHRGYPVADQQADRGADSAFCYRVGSFYFPSGVSGNKNTLQQANFNACGWAMCADGLGFDNVVRDFAFENSNGLAYLVSAVGLKLQDGSGEGATGVTVKIAGTVYNLTLENITGTTNRPLVDVGFTTYGLKLLNCYCRNHSVPPIANAFRIIGGVSIGCLPPYSDNGTAKTGKMFDTDALNAIVQSNRDDRSWFGVGRDPNAPIEVASDDVTNHTRAQIGQSPTAMVQIRDDSYTRELVGTSPSLTGGDAQSFKQIISTRGSAPHSPGARLADDLAFANVATSAAAATFGGVDLLDLHGGSVTMAIVANDVANGGNLAEWRIRQKFRHEGGTVALVGSADVELADDAIDGAYVAPTLVLTTVAFNDGGSQTVQPTATQSTIAGVLAPANSYVRSAGSWITDGLRVGQVVKFAGFADSGNNGSHVIEAVSDQVLTVRETLTSHAATASVTGTVKQMAAQITGHPSHDSTWSIAAYMLSAGR